MSELGKTSPGRHIWRIEQLNERSTGNTAITASRSALSFLSLKEGVNSYPDTGESGDAYDIEASLEH
jgi:hypothetical protein